MPVQFVAYIDEAGDTGLNAVRPRTANAATEWLVLGCTVVRVANDVEQIKWVSEIKSKFKNVQTPYLHFKDLNAPKRHIAIDVLIKKPIRAFVVMSNKKNIVNYRNRNIEDGNKHWLYWWLSRLLLERVTRFCGAVAKKEDIDATLQIVFSKRGGLRYSDFVDYLQKLKGQSSSGSLKLHQGDLDWRLVDFDEIRVMDHRQRAGLQIADIVASSFFQAVERDRPGECDPSYAKALKPIMAHENRVYIGHGLKTMPEIWRMDLTQTQREIFVEYGFSKNGWAV